MPRRGISLEAIEKVLQDSDRPLSSKEIVAEIGRRKLANIAARTPEILVNARISVDIRTKGKESRFKRVPASKARLHTLYTLRERAGEEKEVKAFQKKISPLEDVLVFPTPMLDKIGYFNGIHKDFGSYASAFLDLKNSFLVKRTSAELDERYKQIVSYVIVKYKDSVLRHTRGKITSLDESYRGLYSIGYGGHAKGKDWDLFHLGRSGYEHSAVRELEEEIGIDPRDVSSYNFRLIGALNDDSSDLGRHHFAFIYLLELFEPKFIKAEKSVNELKLVEILRLDDDFERYEYWSKMCIQTYFGERLSMNCHINPRSGFALKDHSEIVLFVGLNGSGKTTACDLLAKEFNYISVPCSQIMQEIIGCGSIQQIGREQLQEFGYKFINERGGHERLAQGIMDFMNAHPGSRYALDGLRYPQTLEALKELLGKPVTIFFIQTTLDNLFRSYKNREGRGQSFDDFMKVLNHPVEREVVKFWFTADVVAYFHGSRDSYLETMRGFFQRELG